MSHVKILFVFFLSPSTFLLACRKGGGRIHPRGGDRPHVGGGRPHRPPPLLTPLYAPIGGHIYYPQQVVEDWRRCAPMGAHRCLPEADGSRLEKMSSNRWAQMLTSSWWQEIGEYMLQGVGIQGGKGYRGSPLVVLLVDMLVQPRIQKHACISSVLDPYSFYTDPA